MMGKLNETTQKMCMLTALVLMHCLAAMAQEDPEYKLEAGAAIGMVTYLGDFNANLLKDAQPKGTLMAKYRPNPRMAWNLSVGYGTLKGASANTKSWMPDTGPDGYSPRPEQAAPVAFSNQLIDATLRYEYNFWPFGTGQEYRGARQFTPFLTFGAGITYVKADEGVAAGNVPIGAGVKYKMGTRLNLTAEWLMNFTLSDKLDGVKDPYGIKSSGLFKNTDGYSVLQVAITYDLWPKCKTCNNDRD